MGAPKLPTGILNFVQKNKWWTLLVAVLCGIILFQKAVEATGKLWDTRKLFYQAKQDTDAIADLRSQIQKQKDALDLLVRDSNTAYKEIAAVRQMVEVDKEAARQELAKVKSLAVKAAPLKQPANSITARVKIEMGATGPNYENKIPEQTPQAGWLIITNPDGFKDKPGFPGVMLVAEKYEKWGNADSADYYLDFHQFKEWLPDNESVEEFISKYNNADLKAFFLPEHAKVLGGSITLIVNSVTKKTFIIPPQIVELLSVRSVPPSAVP